MVKKMMESAIDVEGDGCALPDAIVEDILSRLHSKTLMKLRIVCKKWKTLISTCYFRRLHNENSLKYPNLLLLRHSSTYDYVLTTVSLDGDVLDQWDLPLLPPSLNMLPSQWGTNNLLCFVVNWKRFFVCNPSVRKVIYLPKQRHSGAILAYGFCYLPSTNQYVIISAKSRNHWQMITFSYSNNLKDLSTGGWKPPIKNNTPCELDGYPDGVFVNGVFYWVGSTRTSFWTSDSDNWDPCFLCFSLYEEKLFNVAFPDGGVRSYFCTLHDVNGYLHLFTDNDWSSSWTLWKLEDVQNQTWIKQYTINQPDIYFRPLVVGEDGEMLVYHNEFLEWCIMQDDVITIRRKGDKSSEHCQYVKYMQLHTDTLLMS